MFWACLECGQRESICKCSNGYAKIFACADIIKYIKYINNNFPTASILHKLFEDCDECYYKFHCWTACKDCSATTISKEICTKCETVWR